MYNLHTYIDKSNHLTEKYTLFACCIIIYFILLYVYRYWYNVYNIYFPIFSGQTEIIGLERTFFLYFGISNDQNLFSYAFLIAMPLMRKSKFSTFRIIFKKWIKTKCEATAFTFKIQFSSMNKMWYSVQKSTEWNCTNTFFGGKGMLKLFT